MKLSANPKQAGLLKLQNDFKTERLNFELVNDNKKCDTGRRPDYPTLMCGNTNPTAPSKHFLGCNLLARTTRLLP
jgi:hypothetical protein